MPDELNLVIEPRLRIVSVHIDLGQQGPLLPVEPAGSDIVVLTLDYHQFIPVSFEVNP
jgi:hypothetical protein